MAFITGGRIGGSAIARQRSYRNGRRSRRRPVVIPLPGGSRRMPGMVGFPVPGRAGSRYMKTAARKLIRGYATQRVIPGKGSTFSYYRSRMKSHPRAAAIKRVGGVQNYNFNVSYRLTGNTGQQAYYSWDAGDTSDINSMVTQITGYGDTTDMILDKMYVDTCFTNMSEATVYIDLYECTPRMSIGNANNPGASANEGISDASSATASFNSLGAYPTMSRRFCQLWCIHKKYTLELAQGQSHTHKAYYQMGQKWNQSIYDVYGGGWLTEKFTKSLLVVTSGVPLNDQTTKTNVSTSSTAVDMVRKERYIYTYNNPINQKFTYNNSLPTITTEYIMDIGTGEAETLNAA